MSASLNASSAAFDAQYDAPPTKGLVPARLLMLMIQPPPRRRRCGIDGLAAVEHAGDVRVDDPAPVVVILRLNAAEPADAGVVHEDVESALPACGLVDERLNREVIAHIGRKCQHARARPPPRATSSASAF